MNLRPSGYEGCWKSSNSFIDCFSALSAREILLYSPLFPLIFSCSGSKNGSFFDKTVALLFASLQSNIICLNKEESLSVYCDDKAVAKKLILEIQQNTVSHLNINTNK